MTPERFHECKVILGYSNVDLVKLLGMKNDRLIRRWGSGQHSIPADVEDWLEGFVRHLDQAFMRYLADSPPPQPPAHPVQPSHSGSANQESNDRAV